MSQKYETIYAEHRNALGAPLSEVTDYFQNLEPPKFVLDLGAGQGRDALFIAQCGHKVHAVDISPSGIAQLIEDAQELDLTAEVADLTTYKPEQNFDVILVDRVFHMLGVAKSLEILPNFLSSLNRGGEIYILDEKKDIPSYAEALRNSGLNENFITTTSLRAQKP